MPSKKHIKIKKNKWLTPILFAFILGTISLTALIKAPNFTYPLLVNRVFIPVIRIISIMAISLVASAIVEGLGWSSIVARLARPIMRFGNLSDYSGTAFTTAFLSGIAGNTLLWNFFQEKKIKKEEMTVSVIANHGLPSFFLHLPTTAAIILPLAGKAGGYYLGLMFSAAALRTGTILTIGRNILPKPTHRQSDRIKDTISDKKVTKGWPRVKILLERYLKIRLVRIALFTIPIYILVAALRQWGFFHWLESTTANMISSKVLPIQGISVVVFTLIADFTAGAAAAGAMVQSGLLTVKATVLALLIGNLLATPIRALRHQIPNYIGVFGPKTGTKLLLLSQSFRITSVLLITILYYYWHW